MSMLPQWASAGLPDASTPSAMEVDGITGAHSCVPSNASFRICSAGGHDVIVRERHSFRSLCARP